MIQINLKKKNIQILVRDLAALLLRNEHNSSKIKLIAQSVSILSYAIKLMNFVKRNENMAIVCSNISCV